ncbi:hypothetical protein GC176_00560 [bacterium]|nr:hypothetical protein [bacterium]
MSSRLSRPALLAIGLILAITPSALAQAEAPTVPVVSTRSYTFEIVIVVVMFGLALFAVCRSSQRR